MKTEDFSKRLKQIIERIKSNSKDAHYAQSLIDDLLSIKGQMDVEPMHFCIPDKDVVRIFDNDNVRIALCKGYIGYELKGGIYTFVSPRMKALYGHLKELCDLKDNYDNLSDEVKFIYDQLYYRTSVAFLSFLYLPISDKKYIEITDFLEQKMNELSKELLNKPLQEETHEENAEFENKMQALEEAMNNGEDRN